MARLLHNFPRKIYFYLIFFLLFGVLLRFTQGHTVQAAALTTTLNPTADSYANSASPTTNYGTSTQFRVDGSPVVSSYLLFSIQNLSGTVTNVKLLIYANSAQSTGYDVHTVSDTSWQESTITFANAPAFSPAILGSSGPITTGAWYSVDVTSGVTGNGLVSFALTTNNVTALSLGSRESSTKPQLIIQTDAVVTPTVVPTVLPTPTTVLTPTATLSPMPTSTPTPTPVPGIDPLVAAAGDIVCDPTVGGSCQHMATSDLVLQMNPNAVILLGDNQYESGQYANFLSYYDPSWGRFKSITYPSVGNHEYLTTGASGYFDYFNGIGNFSGSAGDRDKGYYSFDIGMWHIIVLNSNCSKAGGCGTGSPQEKWLRADLAAHPMTCTIAYSHHPRFSSGNHGNFASLQPLWQALYDYNADVVLAGHDHDYERFAPQTPTGNLDQQRGLREFIVGTGGKNHTYLGTSGRIVNSEVFDSTSFGVMKFVLHPTSYDWEFIPIPGNFFVDSGTQQCH